jgi:phage tail sheath protein FI
MAVIQQRAADVRITETDLSSVLVNNSTAAAALVVVSQKGPTKPRRYTNADRFLFDFGQPNARVSFDHYAALKFFEQGNDLWAVRAVGAGAKYSAAIVKIIGDGSTVVAGISAGAVNPENPTWGDYVGVGETGLFLLYPKQGPGSYANSLSVAIESHNLLAPQNLTGTSTPTGGMLVDGSYKFVVSAISGTQESLASTPYTATIAGSPGTAAINLTWQPVAGATGYAIYLDVGGVYQLLTRVGVANSSLRHTGALSPDPTKVAYVNPIDLPTPDTRFTLHIYDEAFSSTTPAESFEVTMNDGTDETGMQTEITQRLNPFSQYLNARSNAASLITVPTIRSTVAPVALEGGDSGTAPGSPEITAAWNLFTDKEQYVVDVLINAGRSSVAVMQAVNQLATKRADCVAFLDVPPTVQGFQEAIDWRNLTLNLNSSYAALFGPDILVADPISGKSIFIPPSGAMAALYAYTARVGAPWFSFAGLNRGLINALDIRKYYDDGQATALYRAQVNYIRKFLGRGIALWEQSTLQNKASALQFLNVRQLLNILKRSMYSYLLYALQDPNDAILRRQVQFGLQQYMDTVQQGRGVSSYKVIVSDALNTPAYVNSGILRVAVVIVPILAVREIQLSMVISKEGLSLSEEEVAAVTS